MRLPLRQKQIGGANQIYLATYKDWLASQSVTDNTSRVYYSRIKQFLSFVEYAAVSAKPLNDESGINEAMELYLDFLKQSQKSNSTINANVNAMKNFSEYLGFGKIQLKRERCYSKSAKILTATEQERFLQAVQNQKSARDKALALVLFYSGLRIGNCSRLNMENIGAGASCIALETGNVIVLNQETSMALRQWLEERRQLVGSQAIPGLWLTQHGEQLKLSSITSVIERIAWQAKLVISAETLRRTWLTRSINEHNNNDELAAAFGGYIGKATLKRYGVSI